MGRRHDRRPVPVPTTAGCLLQRHWTPAHAIQLLLLARLATAVAKYVCFIARRRRQSSAHWTCSVPLTRWYMYWILQTRTRPHLSQKQELIRFARMPFGLKNATHQQVMEIVLDG